MQTTIASVTRPTAVPPSQTDASTDANGGQWGSYNLIRRNGSVVGFEPSKIAIAMTKAFLAVNGGQGAASARVRELVESLTAGRQRAGAQPSRRRHLPYRRRAGPGRTGADALGRA